MTRAEAKEWSWRRKLSNARKGRMPRFRVVKHYVEGELVDLEPRKLKVIDSPTGVGGVAYFRSNLLHRGQWVWFAFTLVQESANA